MSASCTKILLQETVDSEESYREKWTKLKGSLIVSGERLRESLRDSISCCFCQGHVNIMENSHKMDLVNPLTPVPPVTAHAETHPQFPVPLVTAREKACEDNCLSYPPWRYFGPPIVLLLLRTNKPMRMDFLSIFLVDFRGPRKTVFCLKITH